MRLFPVFAAVPALLFACAMGLRLDGILWSAAVYVDIPEVERRHDWPNGPCCVALNREVALRRGAGDRVEIFLEDRRTSLEGLRRGIAAFAEMKRDLEHPLQPSEVWIDLRVAKDVPWFAVRRVLSICEEPDVRVYKIRFAVRERRR